MFVSMCKVHCTIIATTLLTCFALFSQLPTDNKEVIHVIDRKPFDYSLQSFWTDDEPSFQGMDAKGLLFRCRGRLGCFKPRTLEPAGPPQDLPGKGSWSCDSQPKFRNGSWFFRESAVIKGYPHASSKAVVVLDAGLQFSQFDVAPDGSILLIGSGLPRGEALRASSPMDPWDYTVTGSGRLLRIFAPGERIPLKEIRFPGDYETLTGIVNHLPGPDGSFWAASRLIIHSAFLGRIWCVDPRDWSVREVAVPWRHLELSALEAAARRQAPPEPGKSFFIPCEAFPERFCFLPTSADRMWLQVWWRSAHPRNVALWTQERTQSHAFAGMTCAYAPHDGGTLTLYQIRMPGFTIEEAALPPALANGTPPSGTPCLARDDGTPIPWPYPPPREAGAGEAHREPHP